MWGFKSISECNRSIHSIIWFKEEGSIRRRWWESYIDPSNTKVIRYIAWSNDHDFLHGKFIEPNKGVTYDLIDPSAAAKTVPPPGEGGEAGEGGNNDNNPNNNNNPNNDNNSNNDNKGVVNEKKSDDINEERVINSLLINDVLLNQEWNSLENPF